MGYRTPAAREQDGRLRAEDYDAILQMILSGDLQPGEKHSEPEVARLLGRESRTTSIRGALAVLAADGFIYQRPQVGFWVLPVELREAQELQRLRASLEPKFALSLAQDSGGDRSSVTDEAGAALDAMAEAVTSDPPDTFAFWTAHTEFHVSLAAGAGYSSGARVLREWMQRLQVFRSQVPLGESRSLEDHADAAADRQSALSEDRHLLELIRNGDAAGTANAVTAHLSAESARLERAHARLARPIETPIGKMLADDGAQGESISLGM